MASKDTETQESFAKRLTDMMKISYTTGAIAIGVDLDLFDGMAKLDGAKTSQEIADAVECKERYIREWLNTLVVGDIITYEPKNQTYFLPKHRATALSGNNPESPALLTLYLPLLNLYYKKVTDCFQIDGPEGVEPSRPTYSETRDVDRRIGKVHITLEAVDHTVSQVPGLKEKLENGISVCEAGCGTGQFLLMLAERFPKSEMTGFDIDETELVPTIEEAKQRGLKNVSFVKNDIYNLPTEWANKWDYIFTNEVIHDLPYPDEGLVELYKICKPGAYLSLVECNLHTNVEKNIGSDIGSFVYYTSLFYCVPISLYFKNGAALGAGWGIELATKMAEAAGFKVTVHSEKGEMSFHAICRK